MRSDKTLREYCIENNLDDVIADFDDARNSFTMDDVLYYETKKICWKCHKCGYKWIDTANNRIHPTSPVGCPSCNNLLDEDGKIKNNLLTRFPELIDKEWSNANIRKPDEYTISSTAKARFICPICHRHYYAPIKSKVNGSHKVCENCLDIYMKNNSYPEQALYFYIKKVFPDAIMNCSIAKLNMSIYIPSISTSIEYRSARRRRKTKKQSKGLLAQSLGIRLIRLKQFGSKVVQDEGCVLFYRHAHHDADLSKSIKEILYYLKEDNKIDVNVMRDNYKILEQAREIGLNERVILS